MPTTLRNVCVYCGSSSGRRPAYLEAARALAAELVGRGIGLVYGGASVGVMGALADSVLAGGGRVVGVMPRALVAREVAHAGLTELHVVESMHERKALMVQLSDGFVALPGGFGTLDELFESLTWAQLGIHGKPCALLDVEGYFEGLCTWLDRATAEGFLRVEHRALLLHGSDPRAVLDAMAAQDAPDIPKWLDLERS